MAIGCHLVSEWVVDIQSVVRRYPELLLMARHIGDKRHGQAVQLRRDVARADFPIVNGELSQRTSEGCPWFSIAVEVANEHIRCIAMRGEAIELFHIASLVEHDTVDVVHRHHPNFSLFIAAHVQRPLLQHLLHRHILSRCGERGRL